MVLVRRAHTLLKQAVGQRLAQQFAKYAQMASQLPVRALSDAANSEILREPHGSKRVVTLNRPKALNALNLNMVRELYALYKKWDLSNDISMIILKGAGEKAFCAGGDVLAVTKSAKSGGTVHKDFFSEEYRLNHLIGTLSKPHVALLNGIVMGGGCGVSVNGAFRVATEKTLLAMPETAIGLFPDVGASYFLSRLADSLGPFLGLTGYRLRGADAFHVGLATHFVESEKIPALEQALLSLPDPVTDADVEKVIRTFEPTSLPPYSLEPHLPAIRQAFHEKTVEGVLGALQSQKTDWAKKQADTILKMSPTSCKVTLRQLQEATQLPFERVFTMEFRLVQRFCQDKDFFEGCRAVLVDRDNSPKWQPAALQDVSEDKLDLYFSPLGRDLVLPANPHAT